MNDDTPYADDYEASLASPEGDPLSAARGMVWGLALSVALVGGCLLVVQAILWWLA